MKRRLRRINRKRHLKQIENVSEYCGFPGPIYRNNHYKIKGRGKASVYLKKQSNRCIRRNKELYQNGSYRKRYDFWWELT